MKIQTNNKYLARIIARLFRVQGYRIHFNFEKELYDDDVMEAAFLRQALDEFDEDVKKLRSALLKAIDEAPKEE